MDPITAAVTVPVLTLLGYAVVSARDCRRWDRQSWARLERLSSELIGQLDEIAILRIALADTLELFRCDLVTVALFPRHRHAGLVATVTAGGDGEVSVQLMTPEWDTAPAPVGSVVMPLPGSPDKVGVVRVSGCRGRGARVRLRLRLLQGFAHMLASSLGAERMLEQQREAVDDTYQRSLRDHLTGLGNRALLQDQGNRYLSRAGALGRRTAVFLLDVDGFKQINDTLGHASGDRVLIEFARRVAAAAGDGGIAIRLGGDEFAVLATVLPGPEHADAVVARFEEALAAPFLIDDVELAVGASIGVAVQGRDGDSVEALLAAADDAMYAAKGRTPAEPVRRRPYAPTRPGGPDLTAELRAGLPEEQLVVHYQPQLGARHGEVLGFEALLRWLHPELGLLKPGEFLPIAERCGLMGSLTGFVLDRAVADLDTLRLHVPGATVSVNVSARNLLSRGLVREVSTVLDRYALAASSLVLEMPELPPEPSLTIAAAIDGLEQLGCQVSMHDFGFGPSSVTALSHHGAIREVKIHPTLVGAVLQNSSSMRLVTAIVHAAHGLGLRVVGEGVENKPVAQRLSEIGCDRLQGYLFHEPAPVPQLVQWFADRPEWHGASGVAQRERS